MLAWLCHTVEKPEDTLHNVYRRGAKIHNRPPLPWQNIILRWLHGASSMALLFIAVTGLLLVSLLLSSAFALARCSQDVSWVRLLLLCFRQVISYDSDLLERYDGSIECPLSCLMISAVGDMLALIFQTTLIGFLATRLVRHCSSFVFTQNIVQLRRDGYAVLAVRLVENQGNYIHSCHFTIQWMHPVITAEGENYVKMEDLTVADRNNMCVLPHMLKHIVDEQSPLFQYASDLSKAPGVIYVQAVGVDGVLNCQAFGAEMYMCKDIHCNHRFADLVTTTPFQVIQEGRRGKAVADFKHFHATLPIEHQVHLPPLKSAVLDSSSADLCESGTKVDTSIRETDLSSETKSAQDLFQACNTTLDQMISALFEEVNLLELESLGARQKEKRSSCAEFDVKCNDPSIQSTSTPQPGGAEKTYATLKQVLVQECTGVRSAVLQSFDRIHLALAEQIRHHYVSPDTGLFASI